MYTTLYKRSEKNKVLIWEITIEQSYKNAGIVIKTGEYFGVKTLHHKKVTPKNIGKSNETTPLEQAQKDFNALVLGQRKYGYKSLEDLKIDESDLVLATEDEFINTLLDTLPEFATDLDGMLKPMLASQYFRKKENWTDPTGKVWKDRMYYYLNNPHVPKEKGAVVAKFPCHIQPKINGVRCSVYLEHDEVKMKSKDGEVYIVEHIISWFSERKHLFINGNNEPIVYDGELYIHNESLQNIRSAVVKPNLSTYAVTYEIYDLAIPNHSNRIRFQMLKGKLLPEIENVFNCPVNYVKTYIVNNDKEVQYYCDKFIEDGYEGVILRDPDATYQFGKRRVNMLKLKRLIQEEFLIIGIKPQTNDPSLGNYICTTKDGQEFDVTPTENEEYKQLMIMNPSLFIGKQLTCTFYEYTDLGKPFHINHNIVRDYENNDPNKVF